MNLTVLLVGLAAGMAVAAARLYAERVVTSEVGLSPRILKNRDVIAAFLVLATAANVYAAWLAAAYGGISSGRASALLATALLAAGQLLQLAVAFRPSRRDLDLALASCVPYVYLFALYVAALATNSYTLWLF